MRGFTGDCGTRGFPKRVLVYKVNENWSVSPSCVSALEEVRDGKVIGVYKLESTGVVRKNTDITDEEIEQ